MNWRLIEGVDFQVWLLPDGDNEVGFCIGSGLTEVEALQEAARALGDTEMAINYEIQKRE